MAKSDSMKNLEKWSDQLVLSSAEHHVAFDLLVGLTVLAVRPAPAYDPQFGLRVLHLRSGSLPIGSRDGIAGDFPAANRAV
jgi:hypothetical protein